MRMVMCVSDFQEGSIRDGVVEMLREQKDIEITDETMFEVVVKEIDYKPIQR